MISAATREAIIGRLLVREGGVEDIHDGAGVTAYGQTGAWLAAYNLPFPQTPDAAKQNYREWLMLSKLDQLPDDLASADAVIDYALNSGEARAIKAVQHALGVTEDGVIGPVTRAALETAHPDAIRRAVTAARLRLLGVYLASHPQFARGLLNRVADLLDA